MGGLALFLLAASLFTVKPEGAELRESCDEGDAVVARIAGGAEAKVKFGLGACYAVEVSVDGKAVSGFLAAGQIAGIEAWEAARREAPSVKTFTDSRRGGLPVAPGTHPLSAAAQLLADNRPGEALEVAERALVNTPRDAQLLAVAGIAAHRNDMSGRAIGYLKDSLAIRADAAVQRALDQALRETAADKSGEQLQSTRFSLRYDTSLMPADTARALLGVLEQEYTRISFELGCKTAERIAVIAQSRDDYRRATGAAEWSGGLYDGRIRVAVPEGDPGGAMTRQALAHEVVHACLAATGHWPAWFHEGLAQRLSGETLSPARQAQVRDAIRGNAMPTLANLSQSWSRMSPGHAALAYATALYALELFYRHHSAYGIRNLVRNPEELPRFAADLDRLLRR